ncbi:hypothetical protein EXW28_14305 [Bacillus mycoides]|uniref:hypothetical protein n=1 Tax=Bacillus mycoides TaxID=1405 RepID=UPI001C037C42|nr:hypothetical protein [Bacillus mycoides]NUC18012.1 hypothetical protein [Bacillus mycoides]QWG50965.1 hypothetical protein EXW37_14300 [Bacillus mycoides]QWG56539.1 hypothetical protein EXW26_14445 [Bacillus mycoides]QWH23539.1 hypothetical protein EXW50_14415 [Bacillus mycoides]QWH34768.1 hypothetical protein EXW28_14305 [Bacillus mycoides]
MKLEPEEIVIPILDLEKFMFSPPGPMGWEMSEYEQTLEKQKEIVLDESSILENLAIIKDIELVELPTMGLLELETISSKTTTIDKDVNDEINDGDIQIVEEEAVQSDFIATEPEKPKIKIQIITPNEPLKRPWIAGILKHFKEKE